MAGYLWVVMYEVKALSHESLEVKQSKFLSFFIPMTHLDSTLSELKKAHPKARHFIVAWRNINEYEQIEEYSTDDGEPKGTSGRPVLNVLRGGNIVNSAIIIVRYFGGTKLGTGGLVRAYTDAAQLVIKNSSLYPFESKKSLEFEVSYTHHKKVEHYLDQEDIEVVNLNFIDSGVCYNVLVTLKQEEVLQAYEQEVRVIKLL